jgi:hypothetical protein
MQASETDGKLSDVFTEKHHMFTAKTSWYATSDSLQQFTTLRIPLKLSRLEETFHDTARAMILRVQTT